MTAPTGTSARRAGETGLAIQVRGDREGPVLATSPVQVADLSEAQHELWWRSCVRRGMPDVSERDLEFSLQAVPRTGGSALDGTLCRGFVLATRDGDGVEASLTCAMTALQPIAQRAAEDLQRRGLLGQDSTFYYELVLDGPDRGVAPLTPPGGWAGVTDRGGGQVLSRSQSLHLTDLSLAALMQRSTAHGTAETGDHELFWTQGARERAERIARLGEVHEPAVETGGVLLGYLGYCSEARDAFVVVVDALEAKDAEQREFSLSFSGKTWQRLQTVVRARAADLPGLCILGQMHGHPFSPGEPCAACPGTEDCPKQTAYLSEHDRRWTRAVFNAQPWQVSQMYGVDAKGTPTSNTFGLVGGRLERRGYRLIAEEDLEHVRQLPAKGGRP